MRLDRPFSAISPSGLDAQVLHVLAQSHRYLSASQIHRALPDEGSLAGVKKSIARFVEQGTVVDDVIGRSRGFALNDEHLLADAIREIASAKRLLVERMRGAIATWPFEPVLVAIFGSAARDDMRVDSDIDVLFVLPDDLERESGERDVHALAARMAAWTGNDVRPLVYAADEVGPARVFSEILDDAMPIVGRLGWLRGRSMRQLERS
ncbi:hypothetical protein GCM10009846_03160 [Agrococcus versicolor]|uniref:Polymerase nucleotidyl transferase domain-containing protein n=1 Tax=Agrococcus versicolor TaxID=501482 RepID=A0ABN3AJG6_9MICO